MDFGSGVGRDDAQLQAGFEQAANFLERYVARADEEGGAAFEIQEDRQKSHVSS